MVKYGFVLKQWFIASYTSKTIAISFDDALSWCNKTGYRLPKVRDLINASSCHPGACAEGRYINEFPGGATPSSPDYYLRRHIGAGFFTEWGDMSYYSGSGASFNQHYSQYYSSELTSDGRYAFSVHFPEGYSGVSRKMNTYPVHIGFGMLCVYP